MKHTFVHSRMTQLMKSFNHDAHPMGMFISSMAAMSTFHPEANPAMHVKRKNNICYCLLNFNFFRVLIYL